MTIALVITLAFIWGNSMLDGPSSHSISDKIVDLFDKPDQEVSTPVTDGSSAAKPDNKVDQDVNTTDEDYVDPVVKFVRKGAHGLEFLILGVICAMLFFYDSFGLQELKNLALMGLAVPLVDETIQIFSERTHSISDIWVDLGGFAAGLVIVLSVKLIRGKINIKQLFTK